MKKKTVKKEIEYLNKYTDAHCRYVSNTLDGMKPEEAYKILQEEINNLKQ